MASEHDPPAGFSYREILGADAARHMAGLADQAGVVIRINSFEIFLAEGDHLDRQLMMQINAGGGDHSAFGALVLVMGEEQARFLFHAIPLLEAKWDYRDTVDHTNEGDTDADQT